MNYRMLHKKLWKYVRGSLPSSVTLWLGLMVLMVMVVSLYTLYGYLHIRSYFIDVDTRATETITSTGGENLIHEDMLDSIIKHYR